MRLQRYKDGGLSDVKTFKAADGLTWIDAAGRAFSSRRSRSLPIGAATAAMPAGCGPKRFPRNNKFGQVPANGKGAGGEVGAAFAGVDHGRFA